MKVSVAQLCLILCHPWTVAHKAPLSRDFPGKNTGVGCHFLLQGIFPTQGSKPGFLHCKQILDHLSHQGSPEKRIYCILHSWYDWSTIPRIHIPLSWWIFDSPRRYICLCCVCVCAHSVTSHSLQPHGLKPAALLCPWNFPGNNIGVGSHVLPQWSFPKQGLSLLPLHLLHWQADSLPLSH